MPNNHWYGPNALPPIAASIVINGNGATLQRSPAAPPFRLFYIAGTLHGLTGSLALRELTIRGGLALDGDSAFGGAGAGMGGAIFNQGSLTLRQMALLDNLARGGSGGANTHGGGIGQAAQGFNGGGFGPGFFPAPGAGGEGGSGGVNSGGSTMTMAIDAGSPAYNATVHCGGELATDQRGHARVDGAPDLGAFEFGALPGVVDGVYRDGFETRPAGCPQ